MIKSIFLFVLFCCPLALLGQELRKNKRDLGGQLGGQIELYVGNGQRFYVQGAVVTAGKGKAINSGRWREYAWQAGYERWLRERWAVGANYTRFRTVNALHNQWGLYGLHNGQIGRQWRFLKSGGVALLHDAIGGTQMGLRLSGSAYLGRRFQALGKKWQFGLQGRCYKDTDVAGDPRSITGTQWRFRLDFPIGNKVVMQAFFAKSTQYFFGLPQERFDASGNLIESIPYHRLNMVAPVLGFSCRILLHSEKAMLGMPFNWAGEQG